MVNVTANGCTLMEEGGLNPFLKVVRNWMKRHTSFNHSCPLNVII